MSNDLPKAQEAFEVYQGLNPSAQAALRLTIIDNLMTQIGDAEAAMQIMRETMIVINVRESRDQTPPQG